MLTVIESGGVGPTEQLGFWSRRSFACLKRLADVLADARDASALIGLGEARRFAAAQLMDRGELTPLSADRLTGLWPNFERYAWAKGVELVHEVTPELVSGFVRTLKRGGGQPAVATMHVRRDSIRLLFRVLREVGVADSDPTWGIVLPSRSGLATRPLTDDEVELCQWAALSTVTATRHPALWALGEAGASTREIAWATCRDVDLPKVRVRLHGAPRTEARWAPLTGWGAAQLGRRIRHLRADPEAQVAFDRDVDEHAGRISAGQTLAAIMARAGLADDPEVKPRSLAAWVGRRVWLETGRIDEAARRLGLRSLDLTAELVGFDWRAGEDQA